MHHCVWTLPFETSLCDYRNFSNLYEYRTRPFAGPIGLSVVVAVFRPFSGLGTIFKCVYASTDKFNGQWKNILLIRRLSKYYLCNTSLTSVVGPGLIIFDFIVNIYSMNVQTGSDFNNLDTINTTVFFYCKLVYFLEEPAIFISAALLIGVKTKFAS